MVDLAKRAAVDESRKMTEQLRELDTDIDVSYDEFKTRVLPLLADRGENFNVQNWIALTSHPNVGVRVLNDDNELMYYVPPFLDNTEMRTRKDMNLSAFANDLDNISADRPRSKDSFLYNVLSSYGTNDEDMIVSSVDAIIELNKIYADHNMPLIEIDESMRAAYVELKGVEPEVQVSNGENSPAKKAKPVEESIFEDDGFELP